MHIIATVLCAWFCISQVSAGEVIYAYVDNDDDHYYLHLDMRVNGDAENIYRILVDFDNMHAINETIVESKRLSSRDNDTVHEVEFISEGCVLFFCKRIRQLVTVRELGQGFIVSSTDPAKSDLKHGRTLWEVIDEGEGTRLKYNADYVPDFWVPPVIGPAIFKNRMYEEGLKTVNGIEKLANKNQNDSDLF